MRVAIVDDEVLARQRFERLLSAHRDVQLVASLDNASVAIETLSKVELDVVILDVCMPGHTGFEVAEALAITATHLVFVTAHDEYAVQAFAVDALHYLLKPVDEASVAAVLNRVRTHLNRSEKPAPRFAVRDESRYVFVSLSEVESVVAAGNYVELHTNSRCHLLRTTLSAIEGRLASNGFVKIHRSVLVRVACVASIEPLFRGEYLVTLQSGATFPSSRTQRLELRHALGF